MEKKSSEKLVEEILLKEYDRYYRLAYSYVHNPEDAGDIVQNGAYKALRASRTVKNPEYAHTWVYRIMLNEIFNVLRQPKYESYEQIQEDQNREIGYAEDTYKDIDLVRALDSLKPQDKAVILLKFFEEKKLEEIAEILDENLNTIKSRLYRGINKLRVKMDDKGGEAEWKD